MCKDCGCSLGEHHHSHEHSNSVLGEAKTVEVISKILDSNDKEAAHNREHLESHNVLALNLMSSPGSGKTTLLEATIDKNIFKLGVIEGDLETDNDANRIRKKGAPAYQITTSQTCHLDAFMVHEGLHHIPLEDIDLLFIENVGNLVCPASYDVGAHLNVVLLSVTEGDDKPTKYPVMFRKADLVLITKSDLAHHFDFDVKKAIKAARELNPSVDIIQIDSKSGTGIDKWIDYLKMKKELR